MLDEGKQTNCVSCGLMLLRSLCVSVDVSLWKNIGICGFTYTNYPSTLVKLCQLILLNKVSFKVSLALTALRPDVDCFFFHVPMVRLT